MEIFESQFAGIQLTVGENLIDKILDTALDP